MKCIRVLILSSLIFIGILSPVHNSTAAPADAYFFSVDTSYAGVSSTEDFTNGAQDNGTGFTIGYKFTEYSLELSYRKYDYTNTHFREEDNTDVVDYIEDTYVSFGIRGQHNEFFESKFGFSLNNVVGTFVGTDGSEFYSPVDGFFFGVYFGTGPKITFNDDLDVFFDFTLRRISRDIFTVGYDLGLRYYF